MSRNAASATSFLMMPWLNCKKAWMQASRTVSTFHKEAPGRWRHHLGGCRLAFIEETWAKTKIARTHGRCARRAACREDAAWPLAHPDPKLKTTLRQAVERTVEVTQQRIGALLNCSAQDNHSPHCHSTWQPNPGRGSAYQHRGKTVQTTETTLEVGELSRAIGLVTSRTKSMKVRTTGLTVRFFIVMIVA